MPVHIERWMRGEQVDIQEKRAGQFPLVWRREDLRVMLGLDQSQPVGQLIEESPLKDGVFEIGDRVGAQQVIEKIHPDRIVADIDGSGLVPQSGQGPHDRIVPKMRPEVVAQLDCRTETLAAFQHGAGKDAAHDQQGLVVRRCGPVGDGEPQFAQTIEKGVLSNR